MADFPDTSFEQLPLPAKRRIDAVCARFEQAWREGRPALETFFDDVPADERTVLLAELLHIDVECRRRAGEDPQPADYLGRFPGQESLVHLVLPAAGRTDTAAGLDSRPPPPLIPGRGLVQVPGYEVLGELGRGGMGVVYKARHLALNRLVALKFILSGTSAPPRHRERFRREAEVVARLRHPNIVQIYDVGEVEGQCFLALEYADGGSLRERLAGSPLEPRAAAMVLEPLARAVQHAHRQGVVHRDLKPANILLAAGGDSVALGNRPLPDYRADVLDLPRLPELLPPLAACTPKLTDFGLARLLDHEGPGSELGIAAGTPQYMSPEQASGEPDCGPLCDVWALGATLYELLTGRPPFRAATARETLRLILEAEPVPPTQLQPSVPRDLETICLKCLEKEPGRRYPGARELAGDLRRFLDGEAIHARRIGRLERTWKWARRRPARAGLLVLLAAAALAGVAAAAAAMVRAHRGWGEAERGEHEARASLGEEQEKARQARLAKDRALGGRLTAERQAAGLLLELAQGQGEAGRPDRGVHDLLAGLRLAGGADPDLERLFRVNLAAWLPYVHPLEQIVRVKEDVTCVALSADGRLFTGGRDGVVRQRDADGQPAGEDVRMSSPIRFLSLAPDGKRLLVGAGGAGPGPNAYRAAVHQAPTGRQIGQDLPHPAPLTDGRIAPGGHAVYTACIDGVVRRWDEAGRPVSPALVHPLPARGLALSPDGRTLAVALGDAEAGRGGTWLWDLSADPPRSRALPHTGPVAAVAFHPSGGRLFTGGSDGRVRVWDVASGRQAGRSLDHPAAVIHLEPTPDGQPLLTVTIEQVARLWDVAGARVVGEFRGGPAPARLGGSRLAVPTAGEVRVHALARPLSRLPPRRPAWSAPETVASAAVFPDGQRLLVGEAVVGRAHGLAWLRDVGGERDARPPWRHPLAEVTRVAVGPQGKTAATVCRQGGASAVCLWEVGTGRLLHRPFVLPVEVRALAFSPDGEELAAGDHRGAVRRWRIGTGQPAGPAWLGAGSVGALAYRPGGGALAVGTGRPAEGRGSVYWLDLPSGKEAGWVIAHSAPVESLAFTADGGRLLVGGRAMRFYQVEGGLPITPELLNTTFCRLAAGGRIVLAGTADGRLHRIGVVREEPARPAVPHLGPVTAADLSAHGRTLLVAGRDGTARLLDVSGPPRPLGPPVVAGRGVVEAQFLGEGRSFFTLSGDGAVRVWPVPAPAAGSVEDLERLVLVRTGRQADRGGALVPLSEEAWALRRARLEATARTPGGTAAWHDARAVDAWQEGALFAARWHLDALVASGPGDRSFLRRRGDVLARLGLPERALADYLAAAGGDRERFVVELEGGLARVGAAGDWPAARWYVEQLLRERPGAAWLEDERAALSRAARRPRRD